MSSRCRDAPRHLLLIAWLVCASAPAAARDLVVCADPDFLPYSNAQRMGFENRVVEMVADELGARVAYRWQPLLRGTVRKTLDAHACDVLAGVPVGLKGVATTTPYYRSSYVFVARSTVDGVIDSFDDPRLRNARVGVELVGADMATTPPARALADRGITGRVRGFPLYGTTPAAERMIDALDADEIDIAIGWGPLIGFYAARARTALVTTPVAGGDAMAFSIGLGVREDDVALRDQLDEALARVRGRVATLLAEYHVPQVMSAAP